MQVLLEVGVYGRLTAPGRTVYQYGKTSVFEPELAGQILRRDLLAVAERLLDVAVRVTDRIERGQRRVRLTFRCGLCDLLAPSLKTLTGCILNARSGSTPESNEKTRAPP